MKILAIETSCDETAVAVLAAEGELGDVSFTILGNALYSQASKHAAFGGVYPSLAKREHAENVVPLLLTALREAGLYAKTAQTEDAGRNSFLEQLLVREEKLAQLIIRDVLTCEKPDIDAIAVTCGPGLEPALWVGINFARALAYLWDLPIVPINHLEGHLVASAVHQQGQESSSTYSLSATPFPLLGLIVSGGHTEFVLSSAWGTYEKVGGTRDDSIGEAFDKVARLLDLPYPGGPELSRLAAKGRPALHKRDMTAAQGLRPLPRPMLRSDDLDFSFSGLKTAVKYQMRDNPNLSDEARAYLAAEFEEASTDVVIAKTVAALEQFSPKAFVLGGGVSANSYLRERLTRLFSSKEHSDVTFLLPTPTLSTDNAIMIGMAGYLAHLRGAPTVAATEVLRAEGDLPW